ncbi:efflux RND transporter periplasmic adaptor subunit [Candidatus Kaiserbacteria bacterium]|nr:efflux RND transporter periplasmic adaptor subunit [Candidatus Kaiserbacteria bacterium]
MILSVKNLVFTWWRYALVVLIVLAIGGYFYVGGGNGKEATLTITSGDFIRKVSVSGTVIATKDVDLGFAANGRIAGTYAKVGQKVYAGTTLAQTENGDLVADLAQAKADLDALLSGTRPEEIAVATVSVANAESALVDAIRSAYTASDDAVRNKADSFFTNPRTDPRLSFIVSNVSLKYAVESERVAVESALSEWALLTKSLTGANAGDSAKQAQLYFARVTTLLADSNSALNQGIPDQTTSASTLSSYITTLATARTSVNSYASALTTAITALDSALKNLALKQAGSTEDSVVAQRAVVANAQSALAKTYVTAPFTGIVTRMDAKVGEIVSPTTSLISMQSDGIFQIETYIPEVVISDVMVGNSATTTLDAYGTSVEFPAIVVAVDPAETMKDGVPAYKTTLAFLKTDSRIRSGMTANVVINIGALNNAVVIPSGTVGNKGGKLYVSVFSDGKATNRSVVTGTSPALGQIEILSGLSDGETILLAPSP